MSGHRIAPATTAAIAPGVRGLALVAALRAHPVGAKERR